mmetsp:Transcript_5794/g.16419  ORF Transcript_5794/g.16419 Transcript_5794/m.16419 type:complete len:229 (+) Transcript_5794:706-1392(+)
MTLHGPHAAGDGIAPPLHGLQPLDEGLQRDSPAALWSGAASDAMSSQESQQRRLLLLDPFLVLRAASRENQQLRVARRSCEVRYKLWAWRPAKVETPSEGLKQHCFMMKGPLGDICKLLCSLVLHNDPARHYKKLLVGPLLQIEFSQHVLCQRLGILGHDHCVVTRLVATASHEGDAHFKQRTVMCHRASTDVPAAHYPRRDCLFAIQWAARSVPLLERSQCSQSAVL